MSDELSAAVERERAARLNICLLCGLTSPCMTEEEGLANDGPGSPCTFEFPLEDVASPIEREPRFFIDHGMVHDRATGKHVTTAPDDETWNGSTITDAVALLNDLVSKVVELEGERERLNALVYAPGEMRCAKCKFVLYRRTLHAHSGNVSAGTSETEPCPNGCGPLWPVTWKEACLSTGEAAERAFTEKQAAETALNTAKEENGRLNKVAANGMTTLDLLTGWNAANKRAETAEELLRKHGVYRVPSTDGAGE